MNMQELLTYVEELTFKTSMFGYDKDEVDIQLDKICDEAEAIILAKEKEIEELKKESKTALGIAAAATGKTMEELEKDTQEDIVETEEQPEEAKNPEEGIHIQEEGSETVTTESPISTVAVANADEAQDEIETVKAQLVAAQKKVADLEAEIAAEKEKTEKAIARAEEAEKSAENNKAPETTDQAYERYMKNADLLCKQLSDLEGRQNAIFGSLPRATAREFSRYYRGDPHFGARRFRCAHRGVAPAPFGAFHSFRSRCSRPDPQRLCDARYARCRPSGRRRRGGYALSG